MWDPQLAQVLSALPLSLQPPAGDKAKGSTVPSAPTQVCSWPGCLAPPCGHCPSLQRPQLREGL